MFKQEMEKSSRGDEDTDDERTAAAATLAAAMIAASKPSTMVPQTFRLGTSASSLKVQMTLPAAVVEESVDLCDALEEKAGEIPAASAAKTNAGGDNVTLRHEFPPSAMTPMPPTFMMS